MKILTRHETGEKIKELQRYLFLADAEMTHAVISVPNDNILRLVASDFDCHVYEPYEILDNNEERQFDVVFDRVRITVKSEEKFRKVATLTPF